MHTAQVIPSWVLCILIARAAIKIEDFKEIIAIFVFPGPCVGPLFSLTKESWRPFSSTFHLNRKQCITTNEKAMVGDTDNVLLQVAAQVQGPLFKSYQNMNGAPWSCAVKKSCRITVIPREILLKKNRLE